MLLRDLVTSSSINSQNDINRYLEFNNGQVWDRVLQKFVDLYKPCPNFRWQSSMINDHCIDYYLVMPPCECLIRRI